MRFSLISLTLAGVAAVGLYVFNRQPPVDIRQLTGSVAAQNAARKTQPAAPVVAEKSERVVPKSPLIENATSARPAAASTSLVIAQATGTQQAPASALTLSPSTTAPSISPAATAPQIVQPANAQATPRTQRVAAQGAAPVVDESALRYFATRGDTARLQAEISRLRNLYPNWTPPADPLAIQSNGDPELDAMWQLYAQAKYADVRKAIAEREMREAGWQAPADLLDRLKLAESRVELTTASDAKNYDTVIKIAAENPGLLTCGEIDALWRLAEAFAKTDKLTRGRDAYLYVLDHCDNSQERVATVQKASELLPPDMLDQLLAKERTPPGGQPEFEAIRTDIARRLVGEGNSDEKLVVSKDYLDRLEKVADKDGLASDALLLGWYYYRRDNLGAAERWFRRAYGKEETASSAEGLALTLTRQKSPLEAETVLYRWRDTSPDTKAAYLAAVANLLALDPAPILQDDVLARMAPAVISGKDAAAAQQFGWYARVMQQPRTAAEWFSAALAWKPDDEPSAYGLVLTRSDLGDKAGVVQIQRYWGPRSERIARLGEPVTAQGGARRQIASQYQPRIDGSQTTAIYQPPQQYAPQPQPYQPQTQQVQQPQYQPPQVQYQPPPQSQAGQYQAPQYQPPQYQASQYQQAQIQQPQAPQPRRPVQYAQRPAAVAPQARTAQPRQVQSASRNSSCAQARDVRQMSPEEALSRGWCLMDLNRPMEAVQAFDAAYSGRQQGTRSDAAYGRSLAYLRAGLTDDAAVAAADAAQTNTRAVELQSAILANRAVNAFKLGRYRETIIALDQRAQIVPEQKDLMSLRGYALLNVGRKSDARRVFQALAGTGNTSAQAALDGIIDPPRE